MTERRGLRCPARLPTSRSAVPTPPLRRLDAHQPHQTGFSFREVTDRLAPLPRPGAQPRCTIRSQQMALISVNNQAEDRTARMNAESSRRPAPDQARCSTDAVAPRPPESKRTLRTSRWATGGEPINRSGGWQRGFCRRRSLVERTAPALIQILATDLAAAPGLSRQTGERSSVRSGIARKRSRPGTTAAPRMNTESNSSMIVTRQCNHCVARLSSSLSTTLPGVCLDNNVTRRGLNDGVCGDSILTGGALIQDR